MSSVDEIKAAIEHLDEKQVAELADWLLHRADDAWDEQMSSDLATGKLDAAIRQAEEAVRAGHLFGSPQSEI